MGSPHAPMHFAPHGPAPQPPTDAPDPALRVAAVWDPHLTWAVRLLYAHAVVCLLGATALSLAMFAMRAPGEARTVLAIVASVGIFCFAAIAAGLSCYAAWRMHSGEKPAFVTGLLAAGTFLAVPWVPIGIYVLWALTRVRVRHAFFPPWQPPPPLL